MGKIKKKKTKKHQEESAHKCASITGRLQDNLPKARRSEVEACAPFPCHSFIPDYLLRSWIRQTHYTLSVPPLLSPT